MPIIKMIACICLRAILNQMETIIKTGGCFVCVSKKAVSILQW